MNNNDTIMHNTQNATLADCHVRQLDLHFDPLGSFGFVTCDTGAIENVLDTIGGFPNSNRDTFRYKKEANEINEVVMETCLLLSQSAILQRKKLGK